MRLDLKPTDLKLKKFDEGIIRRIYTDLWHDRHVGGGPETWFMVIMRFLEYKKLDLIESKFCKMCNCNIDPVDPCIYCDDCLYERQREKE